MYMISAYFDEKTNRVLNRYINKIAEVTDNHFMTENKIPPHLTISAFDVKDEEQLMPQIKTLFDEFSGGKISLVSVGALFPYVFYVTPVLNEYLQMISSMTYDVIKNVPEIKISRFYRPMQWLPHITLGKKMNKEQMRKAFAVMQEQFVMLEGEVVSLGLAKTNPHIDVIRISS